MSFFKASLDSRRTLLLLAATVILTGALQAASSFNFFWWAFAESGANLTAEHLLRQGLLPYSDFSYQYGLLPLTIGRLIFGVGGLTPAAGLAAMTLLNILIAWALARFAAAFGGERSTVWFFALTIPQVVTSVYPSLAHAVEAALLAHAVASQARGNRRQALALATAALFVKPSMSYFYGAFLLVLMARDLPSGSASRKIRSFAREIAPAAATLLGLGAAMGLLYGWENMFHGLFEVPFRGWTTYRHHRSGIFEERGRWFWKPAGVRIGYYLGTVAGFWLAATACLFIGAATRLRALLVGTADRRDELAVSCAVIHAVFVFIIFGGGWGYWLYAYALVMGIAALGSGRRRWVPVMAALAGMALLGLKTVAAHHRRIWQTWSPSAATAGLWAPEDLASEWRKALEMARGEKAVLVTYAGCGELLFKEFALPVSYYFLPGWVRPGDVERKIRQVRGASLVVEVIPPKDYVDLVSPLYWPEFGEALAGLKLEWEGRHFRVYRSAKSS